MEYNTMDLNEYISFLSKITKLDKKKVYVIVLKNLMAVSAGKIALGDAYCNISSELTDQVSYNTKSNESKSLSNYAII